MYQVHNTTRMPKYILYFNRGNLRFLLVFDFWFCFPPKYFSGTFRPYKNELEQIYIYICAVLRTYLPVYNEFVALLNYLLLT